MFNHKPPLDQTPTTEVDIYQTASDPKTEAPVFITTAWNELALEYQIHPWHAANPKLLQLAQAAIGYAQDRLAEVIYDESVRDTKEGKVLPTSTEAFVRDLSKIATEQMATAQTVFNDDTNESFFDEDTRENLQPENSLPYWPFHPLMDEAWQRPEAGTVNLSLVKATVQAGRYLQAEADGYVTTATSGIMPAVPPEYASLPDLLRDGILMEADTNLEKAEGFTNQVQLTGETLATAYKLAHDGYIKAMLAMSAVVCPPILGPDWFPNR